MPTSLMLLPLSALLSAAAPDSAPAGKPADRREVIRVANAEEFLRALGSDRILKLAPAEYRLSEVEGMEAAAVRWDKEFDGRTLTVRGVRNLSIVCEADKPARLIVKPRYVFVLNFEGCEGVELSNLYLGHEPDRGECSSGVVGATDCRDLTLRRCDLFGCGTEGLTLQRVKGMKFEESVIRDCSYGIVSAAGCEGLRFVKSRFADNVEFWGLRFEDCREVRFADCTVENNTAGDEPLFKVAGRTEVIFEGGAIRNNRAAALADSADQLFLRQPSVRGNVFGPKP